tara:strand:+ start:4054 stop:4470 length:417 start_codon:yes stop_codon:yes gene_type:complete
MFMQAVEEVCMQKSPMTQNKKKVYVLVLFQVIVALSMSLLFLLLYGLKEALDALLGGIVAFIPNFVFASMTFATFGARQLDKTIRFFYWGEALKILLTIMLFTVIFVLRKVDFASFFLTYVFVLSTHGLVFLVSNNDN